MEVAGKNPFVILSIPSIPLAWRRHQTGHCRRSSAGLRGRSGSVPRLRPRDEEAVDLRRHDEVVLVEDLDLLRAQREGRVAPAEADVRMVTLRLRKIAHMLHEAQRLAEVPEAEGALDAVSIVDKLPIQGLRVEALRLVARERRNAAAAGRAGLLGKIGGHEILPTSVQCVVASSSSRIGQSGLSLPWQRSASSEIAFRIAVNSAIFLSSSPTCSSARRLTSLLARLRS